MFRISFSGKIGSLFSWVVIRFLQNQLAYRIQAKFLEKQIMTYLGESSRLSLTKKTIRKLWRRVTLSYISRKLKRLKMVEKLLCLPVKFLWLMIRIKSWAFLSFTQILPTGKN